MLSESDIYDAPRKVGDVVTNLLTEREAILKAAMLTSRWGEPFILVRNDGYPSAAGRDVTIERAGSEPSLLPGMTVIGRTALEGDGVVHTDAKGNRSDLGGVWLRNPAVTGAAPVTVSRLSPESRVLYNLMSHLLNLQKSVKRGRPLRVEDFSRASIAQASDNEVVSNVQYHLRVAREGRVQAETERLLSVLSYTGKLVEKSAATPSLAEALDLQCQAFQVLHGVRTVPENEKILTAAAREVDPAPAPRMR